VRAARIATFAVLAGCLLGVLIGGLAFDRLNLIYAKAQGASNLLIRPHQLTWFMIMVPIATSLSVLAYDPIVSRLAGSAPPRFSILYFNNSEQLPNFIRIGAILIGGVFSVIALLHVPYHVRLSETGMFLCEFGEWTEQERPFQSVQQISLAHYFNSGSKYSAAGPSATRAVFVTTKDGTVWTPVNSMLANSPEISREVALHISRKTGIEIVFPDRVERQPSEEERQRRDRRF